MFAAVVDPEKPGGKPIVHSQVLSWEAVDDEAGCLEDEDDLTDEVEPGVDDCDVGETILTDKYGTLFFRSSDVRIYNQPECGCSTVLKAGSTESLQIPAGFCKRSG